MGSDTVATGLCLCSAVHWRGSGWKNLEAYRKQFILQISQVVDAFIDETWAELVQAEVALC